MHRPPSAARRLRVAPGALARLALALALAAGLAVGPLGAVSHAFEHAERAGSAQQKRQSGHAGAACHLCAAYSAFAHGAADGGPAATAAAPAAFAPGLVPVPAPARSFVPYFERGPPPLLRSA